MQPLGQACCQFFFVYNLFCTLLYMFWLSGKSSSGGMTDTQENCDLYNTGFQLNLQKYMYSLKLHVHPLVKDLEIS